LPANREAKLSCLVLLPASDDYKAVRTAILEVCKEVAVGTVWPDEAQPGLFSLPPGDAIYSVLNRVDLVIAEITIASPNVFIEIGIAQGMGKPCIFLVEEDATPPRVDTRIANYIQYGTSAASLDRFQQRLRKILLNFRNSPRRYARPNSALLPMGAPPLIDLEKLEPREFENLCFELLSQMGFRRVEWGKELREIDVVATLPKKDPDGFQYQELWLISLGLHAPIEMLMEMAAEDPRFLLDRILSRPETSERFREYVREDTTITVLFISMRRRSAEELSDRLTRRLEKRVHSLRQPFNTRLRVWDRDYLAQLIGQFPQLGYKYFSEEARSQSRYRKTPEELYKENVQLTERLQAALVALREERDKRAKAERDAVWKDLSYTAAHKLGNPVFALETDLQGLKKRIPEGAKDALEVADEMGSSLEKAKLIIEQFKSLTKAQEISPRPIEIAPILCNACRILKEKGVELEIRLPDKMPKVLADPDRITECFDEIIVNALHWLDKSVKKITASIELPKQKDLPASLDLSRHYVRIRFEDNGCGVPTGTKQRIFAPFYTTHPHGTGLGLALVQRVVEGHKGTIEEKGKPGDGATFEIYLPVANKNEARG